MATVRTQFAEAEQECMSLSNELHSVALQAQEREHWWLQGVGALEVGARRAVEERNRFLLVAEQNWTERQESLREAESNAQRQAQQQQRMTHSLDLRYLSNQARRQNYTSMGQRLIQTMTLKLEP